MRNLLWGERSPVYLHRIDQISSVLDILLSDGILRHIFLSTKRPRVERVWIDFLVPSRRGGLLIRSSAKRDGHRVTRMHTISVSNAIPPAGGVPSKNPPIISCGMCPFGLYRFWVRSSFDTGVM